MWKHEVFGQMAFAYGSVSYSVSYVYADTSNVQNLLILFIYLRKVKVLKVYYYHWMRTLRAFSLLLQLYR